MAYRKGLVLSFGLVNVIVSIDGAVGKEESLTSVCCGPTGGTQHAPTPISQVRTCKHCVTKTNPAGIVEYADLKKAREVGSGQYQIADQQEVAATKDATLGATKKMLTLTVHDNTDVAANTLQGDGAYYISPEGPAQIGAYSLLLDAVKRNPDKAFLTQFTPTSSAGLWQLKAFGDVLVMEKRCWPEQVKAVPAVGAIEPDAGLQAQMDMVIESMAKSFDPADYRNTYAADLDALLTAKGTVEGEVAERKKSAEKSVATAGVVDLSSQLAAMLSAATPKAAPKRKAKSA
jgi:DNA end-binding protein Ku